MCIVLPAEPLAGMPSRVLGALLHGTGAAECHRCHSPTHCLLSAAPCALAGCAPTAYTPPVCTIPPPQPLHGPLSCAEEAQLVFAPQELLSQPPPVARRAFLQRAVNSGRPRRFLRPARSWVPGATLLFPNPCFGEGARGRRCLSQGEAGTPEQGAQLVHGIACASCTPATLQCCPFAPLSRCTAGSGQRTLECGSVCFS